MGLGCWAIGGVAYRDGRPTGYGSVNDETSIQAIHLALEEDVTLVTFGDMLRVPVNVPRRDVRSLEQAKAASN